MVALPGDLAAHALCADAETQRLAGHADHVALGEEAAVAQIIRMQRECVGRRNRCHQRCMRLLNIVDGFAYGLLTVADASP